MSNSPIGRRRFLTVTGAIGLGAFAGCSGGGNGDGGGSTEAASPTPTASSPTPNPQAVSHYNSAIDSLLRNKRKLEEWAQSSFEPSLVGELQDRLSSARDELSAAEEAAKPGGALMVQIEQATLVADVQELSLAYYEGVNVLFQVISEAKSFGKEELHQRAAGKFSEAQEITGSLRTVIDDMGSTLDQLDTEALDEPDLAYTGEPLDHLDLVDRGAIDGVERYLVGYEHIHLAFVRFEAGQKRYENKAFADARTAWETGRDLATQSKSAFEAAIDNQYLTQNLNQESIKLLGMVETVIEAFDKFVAGAEQAEAGNTKQANDLITEGFEILGQM